MKSTLSLLAFASLLALPLGAAEPAKSTKETGMHHKAGAPSLTATLVDKEEKAKKQTATVKAEVGGIKIIDPATVGEKPKAGEGHLHYQVDDGPVIATTAPKLSFHGLKPGSHTIKVMLAANDHSPLGPEQSLTVDIK